MKRALVTGACGFIGAYLTRSLVREGWKVTAVENMLRGASWRIADIRADLDLQEIDVRDVDALTAAAKGVDVVFHLAAVNGTENFYNRPELVLDVGVRGMLSVVDACQNADVPDLVVASSAEVYQTPPSVPTDETVPLMLPDSLNPRYSYGGSKIISELIAFNYGLSHFGKVQVFRPHNIYGPDMGYKHVIPQLLLRALEARSKLTDMGAAVPFPILGSGQERRAFCFVDDVVSGILAMYRAGKTRQVYHIGNDHMVSIADLVGLIGEELGLNLDIVTSEAPTGETALRCPSIEKMKQLGYSPQVDLREGLRRTRVWYEGDMGRAVDNEIL